MNRYFSATAMGGRLLVDARLSFQDEAVVDLFANLRFGHRKVRTTEELSEVIRVSERGLPAIRVWIHESLQDVVRRIMKEQKPVKSGGRP
jgi:hypothetical protein